MSKTACSKRLKAVTLRKKGLSYTEISQSLNVPKSTLSSWLSSLPLSKIIKRKNIAHAKIISARNITRFNKQKAAIYQKSVKQALEKYASELSKLTKKDLFHLGLGLFLAEGGKREKWSVRFVNSDPFIIKIMMRFFREICEPKEDNLRCRIHIHPNVNYKKTVQYWSNITKIPQKYFWQPQIILSKTSRGKRNPNQLPYGTLHVIIMNANQLRKIKGWLMGLAAQF